MIATSILNTERMVNSDEQDLIDVVSEHNDLTKNRAKKSWRQSSVPSLTKWQGWEGRWSTPTFTSRYRTAQKGCCSGTQTPLEIPASTGVQTWRSVPPRVANNA